jgi:hypothetical protein
VRDLLGNIKPKTLTHVLIVPRQGQLIFDIFAFGAEVVATAPSGKSN